MLECMDGMDFLVLAPRGGSSITLPLAQHLSILEHAIVTIATRGLPQKVADLHVARACVDALRAAFVNGVRILNGHVFFHRRHPREARQAVGPG